MSNSETKPYETKMESALNYLDKELGAIRAGRANTSVLDKVLIDYYGTPTPINQVAAVAVTESRVLLITPWEPTMLQPIEKAIQTSDVGINPTNDGKAIRLVFPSPTEERRKQLAKDILSMGEDAKIAVRNIRREAIDNFKKQKKENAMPEDYLTGLEDTIQKATDKYTKQIDKTCENKTKEIMEI